MNKTPIKAIAVFNQPGQPVRGTVVFSEYYKKIKIEVNLSGLKEGKHGFHVHESGNMLDKCEACKGHFNPYNEVHGGRHSKHRHVGDLGNIEVNSNGIAKETFYDSKIKLRGTKSNIIGRSLVVHEDEDNLGIPGDKESLINGKAGKRLGCAVIGYFDGYYF